jgi:hypothetical protein
LHYCIIASLQPCPARHCFASVTLSGEAAKQSRENPRYFIKSICITKNDVYLCRVKIFPEIL